MEGLTKNIGKFSAAQTPLIAPKVWPKSSLSNFSNPKALAGSNIPTIPIVVFIIKRIVLFPADLKSPCNILFGIVTKFDKLFNALLVPALTGMEVFYIQQQQV